MRNPPAVFASFAVLGYLWTAVPGSAAEPPRRLELTSCNAPRVPAEARCGTYEVFENRAARAGRKIPLRIMVFPAAGSDKLPDPLVYVAGEPGTASIDQALAREHQLALVRQKRDVLVVDLRGTGRSGALVCTELQGDEGIQGMLDHFLPTDRVHACRDRLKKEVDLSWYTTDAAADDLEEVRTALGYGPLNLIGASGGTRAVLTYLRRHPGSVRTVTLLDVAPPDERFPLGVARASQEALDRLIAECEGEPACHGAFPALRQEVDAVLRNAAAKPVRVELTLPPHGRPVEVRLSRAGLAQTLGSMLASPADAALVPLKVHRAAQGDWKPLALSAEFVPMSATAVGVYLSVTCAEDAAFLRGEEIPAAEAGTFLGDFLVRRQKAACEGWPTRDLGPDLKTPVVSDVPALLISRKRDASNGERVARTLKRARQVVVADRSQDDNCLSNMIAAFVEAGKAEALDTSCIARMRQRDFELPEVTVARDDLERLAGSYANEEMGFELKVDLVGDRLRLAVLAGPPFPPSLLVPTSPTRFRWEGEGLAPGLGLVFEVTRGRATTLTVVESGKPTVVLKRVE